MTLQFNFVDATGPRFSDGEPSGGNGTDSTIYSCSVSSDGEDVYVVYGASVFTGIDPIFDEFAWDTWWGVYRYHLVDGAVDMGHTLTGTMAEFGPSSSVSSGTPTPYTTVTFWEGSLYVGVTNYPVDGSFNGIEHGLFQVDIGDPSVGLSTITQLGDETDAVIPFSWEKGEDGNVYGFGTDYVLATGGLYVWTDPSDLTPTLIETEISAAFCAPIEIDGNIVFLAREIIDFSVEAEYSVMTFTAPAGPMTNKEYVKLSFVYTGLFGKYQTLTPTVMKTPELSVPPLIDMASLDVSFEPDFVSIDSDGNVSVGRESLVYSPAYGLVSSDLYWQDASSSSDREITFAVAFDSGGVIPAGTYGLWQATTDVEAPVLDPVSPNDNCSESAQSYDTFSVDRVVNTFETDESGYVYFVADLVSGLNTNAWVVDGGELTLTGSDGIGLMFQLIGDDPENPVAQGCCGGSHISFTVPSFTPGGVDPIFATGFVAGQVVGPDLFISGAGIMVQADGTIVPAEGLGVLITDIFTTIEAWDGLNPSYPLTPGDEVHVALLDNGPGAVLHLYINNVRVASRVLTSGFEPSTADVWAILSDDESVFSIDNRVFWCEGADPPDLPCPPLNISGFTECRTDTTLGDGADLRVYLMTKGGGAVLAELTPTSGSFTRELDATSQLTMEGIVTGRLGDVCCDGWEDIASWATEILVFRDGRDVWCGPVTDVRWDYGHVTVEADDLTAWWGRRKLPDLSYTNTDLARIFLAVHNAAMAEDPSPNITIDVEDVGLLGDRSATARSATYASDVLAELAETSLDYTCYGRTVIVRGGEIDANPWLVLLDEHWTEPPTVRQRGNEQATRVTVKGNGVESVATAEAAYLDYYGLLDRVFTEDAITDQASCDQAAQTRLDLLKDALYVETPVGAKLKSLAPITLPQLIPGIRVRVDTQSTCKKVVADFRLQKVTVDFTGDVSIDLQPIGFFDSTES